MMSNDVQSSQNNIELANIDSNSSSEAQSMDESEESPVHLSQELDSVIGDLKVRLTSQLLLWHQHSIALVHHVEVLLHPRRVEVFVGEEEFRFFKLLLLGEGNMARNVKQPATAGRPPSKKQKENVLPAFSQQLEMRQKGKGPTI